MGDSLLSGVSHSSLLDTASMNPAPTLLQARVDALCSSVKDQLTDPSFVFASLVGGAVYGLTRVGLIRRSQTLARSANIIQELAAMGEASSHLVPVIRVSPLSRIGIFGKFTFPEGFEPTLAKQVFFHILESRLTRLASLPMAMTTASAAHELTRRAFSTEAESDAQNFGLKNGLIRSGLSAGPAYAGAEWSVRFAASLLAGKPKPMIKLGSGLSGLVGYLGLSVGLSALWSGFGGKPVKREEKQKPLPEYTELAFLQ